MLLEAVGRMLGKWLSKIVKMFFLQIWVEKMKMLLRYSLVHGSCKEWQNCLMAFAITRCVKIYNSHYINHFLVILDYKFRLIYISNLIN